MSAERKHVWNNFIEFSKRFIATSFSRLNNKNSYYIVLNKYAPNLNRIIPDSGDIKDVLINKDYIKQILIENKLPFIWFIDESQKHLKQTLIEIGFVHTQIIDWLGMNLSYKPAKNVLLDNSTSLILREVRTQEDLNQWISTSIAGYRFIGKSVDYMSKAMYFSFKELRESITLFTGYFEGNPITTNLFFNFEDTCGIYWVSTRPEYQKKGIGEIMMRKTIKVVHNRTDCINFVLQSTPQGIKLYQKLGFSEISPIQLMLWK